MRSASFPLKAESHAKEEMGPAAIFSFFAPPGHCSLCTASVDAVSYKDGGTKGKHGAGHGGHQTNMDAAQTTQSKNIQSIAKKKGHGLEKLFCVRAN